jgi:Tfp pilus assembly protein PilN
MKNKSEKIRINLLPAKDRNRTAKNKKRLVIFSVIVAYLLFIFILDFASVLSNNFKRSRISKLNQKLTMIETKSILNQTFESAINKRKKLLNTIQKKLTAINNLEKLKVGWNKKIGAIVAASPDGVWMSGLSLDKGIIAIIGNSVSLSGIASYIGNLKKTGLFTKITLEEADRKIIGGNIFYSFNLKAVLNLPYIDYYNKKTAAGNKK